MPRNSVSAAGSPDTHRSDAAPIERQPASNADGDGHVQTLPFGTKALVGSPSTAATDARPYRFVISKLPTFAKHEQAAATHLPPAANPGPDVAAAHRREPEPSNKGRWLLMLGAIAVTAFVFALLVWPDASNLPQEGALPHDRAVGHFAARPQSTAAPAEPRTETASRPATPLESPPRPTSAVERVPRGATTQSQSAASSPVPTPKAGMTLKRGSVLASVLAPPPAD
jgi:hypothetical protein